MDYTIKQVAEMSGVSNRTLRFYHEEKLLEPREMNQSGYRIYGEEELERLQQILLYKELGLKLTVIKQILDNPDFDFLNDGFSSIVFSIFASFNKFG